MFIPFHQKVPLQMRKAVRQTETVRPWSQLFIGEVRLRRRTLLLRPIAGGLIIGTRSLTPIGRDQPAAARQEALRRTLFKQNSRAECIRVHFWG